MKRGVSFKLLAIGLVYTNLLWPMAILAETTKAAGVVTSLKGQATVTHAGNPAQPDALQFKDAVFGRDRISTKEESIVRVLMGGKALITVRELSELTITEEPNKPSVVDIAKGKIGLAVARARMSPGEAIEVRTPNAVAAVRGTVIVVEVLPVAGGAEREPDYRPMRTAFSGQATPVQAPSFMTNFHVLKGTIAVSSLGQSGSAPVNIGAGMSVSVVGGTVGQPQTSPPTQQLVQGLKTDPQHTGQGDSGQEAAKLTSVLAVLGLTVTPPPPPPTTQNVVISTTGCQSNCTPTPPVLGVPLVTFNGFGPSSITLNAPLGLVEHGDVTVGPMPQSFPSATVPAPDVTVNPIGSELSQGTIETPYHATALVTNESNPADRTRETVTLSGGIGLTDSHVQDGEGSDVFRVSGADAAITGSALILKNSSINTNHNIIDITSASVCIECTPSFGSLTGISSDALVTLDSTSSIIANRLVNIEDGGSGFSNGLVLVGPALSSNGGSVTTTGDLIYVGSNSFLGVTSGLALVNLANSSSLSAESLLGIDRGTVELGGPALLAQSGSSVTTSSDLIYVGFNGSLTTDSNLPLVDVSGSTLSVGGNLLNVNANGDNVTLAGPLLRAVNSPIMIGNISDPDLILVNNGASLTGTSTSALVSLTGSPLFIINGSFVNLSGCCNSSLQLLGPTESTAGGPLLSATNSPISANGDFIYVAADATLLGSSSDPLVSLTRSPLLVNGAFVDVCCSDDATSMTLAGPLLSATDSPISVNGDLIYVANDADLTSTSTAALVTLSNSPLLVDGALVHLVSSGTSLSLAGPLLAATNSPLALRDGLVFTEQGSHIILTGSTPFTLVTMTGGVHNIDKDGGGSAMFQFTGSGITDQPISRNDGDSSDLPLGAPLLTTSGAIVNLRQALNLDTALLAANAPLFNFTANGATGSIISSANDFINLSGANLTGILSPSDALVKLNASTLSVRGSLFNVANGSTLGVTGNLFSLNNSSRLNILGGALVTLSAGSTFNLTGSFGTFGSTGTNVLNLPTTTAGLLNCAGCSLVTSGFSGTGNLGGFAVVLGPTALASQITISSGFTPFVGPNTGNSVTAGGILLVIMDDASTVVLNAGSGTAMTSTADANFVDTHLLSVSAGEPTVLSSPLLTAVNQTVTFLSDPDGSQVIVVGSGATLDASAVTNPLISLTNSPMASDGTVLSVVADSSGSPSSDTTVTMGGPLLTASASPITITRGDVISMGAAASEDDGGPAVATISFSTGVGVTDPLITLMNSPLTNTDGGLLHLSSSATSNCCDDASSSVTMTLHGPLLSATNSPIALNSDVINFTADASDFSGNVVNASVSLTSATNSALVSLTNSLLSTGGSFVNLQSSAIAGSVPSASSTVEMALQGPLLSATNSPITLSGDVIRLFASADGGCCSGIADSHASLTSTAPGALVSLTNSPMVVGGNFLNLSTNVIGSSSNATAAANVTIDGPLLAATDSDLTIAGSLVRVLAGGTLQTNSSLPLVSLSGGVHAIAGGCCSAAMFNLAGSSVAVSDTGVDNGDGGTVSLSLGTDRPIRGDDGETGPLPVSAPLFQATNAAITTNQAVKIDTALLEATAPIIKLVSSAMTSNSDAVYLANMAKVVDTVPSDALISMNASVLNVIRGSLVNVAGGSYLNVTGNLLNMGGGSTLNILNGALVTVSGGTVFSLSGGSLVSFGAGTNTLNITNTAALCGGCTLTTTIPNLAGVPVLLGNGVSPSQISVSPSFTALAGLSGSNVVHYTGPSAALIALNGTGRIRLRP